MNTGGYRRIFQAVVIFLLLVISTILAGCSQSTTTSDNTSAEKTGDNSDVYSVAFFFNGEKTAALTLDDIKNLDQVQININGSEQTGPTLLSALVKAGISDFTELTAYGMSRGRLATAESTFTREQVDDTVMLDINNRGKCKLCGANIPQSRWIIDIEKIEAR
jgi:hypothetical protein